MMHPDTEMRLIDEQMGYGVFARRFIPKGTIIYARDPLDQTFAPGDPLLENPAVSDVIEKYTYTEPTGVRVLCWDIGKYVNHCCHPTTLTTGYGFEIAIRDLFPGDEITDDYAIFNCSVPIPLLCCKENCRGMLIPGEFDIHVESWDERIQDALPRVERVEQALWHLLDAKTVRDLRRYLKTGKGYRSIATQKAKSIPAAVSAQAMSA